MSVFSQKVSAISLEECIGDRYIDLLKIGCEGGEYDIFYNSPREVLKRIDTIVMEYHNLPEKNPLFIGSELISFLEKNGFRVIKENPNYDILGRTGIVTLKQEKD